MKALFGRHPQAGSFEATMLPHLDAAHNLARWLVRDAALADDVTQDAMVRALAYYPSFRGGSARAWLMRVVRNVAYDALASVQRGRAVHAPLDEEGALAVADLADGPEAALARGDDTSTLERALAALPTDLRECLVLREFEALSYKEIADVTGVPIGTVMSRLWRARRDLMASATEAQTHAR